MKIDRSDVEMRLRTMPGWSLKDDALTRVYPFPSFADAIAFVTRLAFDAEARDHHPDLLISYRKVTVTWSTHSEGGITDKDFVGAAESERLAARLIVPVRGL